VDTGSFFLLFIWFTLIIFLIQRTEASRRRLVIALMVFVGFLTWYWANFRGLGREFLFGLLAGLGVNLIFWLLIGRYNPVGSSDDIQVIGMDD